MNPLYAAAVGSILRWALALGAGLLVEHGIWTQADATLYVTAGAFALVSLGWSQYQKFIARQKIVTAVSLVPGLTELQLEAHIATVPQLPSARTAVNVVPVPKA
jgi:hypothetical protein